MDGPSTDLRDRFDVSMSTGANFRLAGFSAAESSVDLDEDGPSLAGGLRRLLLVEVSIG